MAIREYQCPQCGPFDLIFHRDYPKHLFCPECGRLSWYNLVPKGKSVGLRTIVDFRAGWDPGLGEYVDTKRQRETLVRENNLRRVKD